MNKLERQSKKIRESGLTIELDLDAGSVLFLALLLKATSEADKQGKLSGGFYILLSYLISALEYEFLGTEAILFPDFQLDYSKRGEL